MEKFAVIITKTIYHEGDERSRTNPGHGYPAYSENYDTLVEFKSEKEFLCWVEDNNKRQYSRETFRAIKFKDLSIKNTVSYE